MAAGDVKLTHGASVAYTITLASLATDANRLAGRESTAVAHGTPWTDLLIGGKITTGTTPTVNTHIEVMVYAAVEDTPTYPDVFDGTDSAETITNANIKDVAVKQLVAIKVTATSNVTYWFGPFSLAELFGGVLPTHHGIFVTHNTGVNLHATGSNHAIEYTPIYAQVEQ